MCFLGTWKKKLQHLTQTGPTGSRFIWTSSRRPNKHVTKIGVCSPVKWVRCGVQSDHRHSDAPTRRCELRCCWSPQWCFRGLRSAGDRAETQLLLLFLAANPITAVVNLCPLSQSGTAWLEPLLACPCVCVCVRVTWVWPNPLSPVLVSQSWKPPPLHPGPVWELGKSASDEFSSLLKSRRPRGRGNKKRTFGKGAGNDEEITRNQLRQKKKWEVSLQDPE